MFRLKRRRVLRSHSSIETESFIDLNDAHQKASKISQRSWTSIVMKLWEVALCQRYIMVIPDSICYLKSYSFIMSSTALLLWQLPKHHRVKWIRPRLFPWKPRHEQEWRNLDVYATSLRAIVLNDPSFYFEKPRMSTNFSYEFGNLDSLWYTLAAAEPSIAAAISYISIVPTTPPSKKSAIMKNDEGLIEDVKT